MRKEKGKIWYCYCHTQTRPLPSTDSLSSPLSWTGPLWPSQDSRALLGWCFCPDSPPVFTSLRSDGVLTYEADWLTDWLTQSFNQLSCSSTAVLIIIPVLAVTFIFCSPSLQTQRGEMITATDARLHYTFLPLLQLLHYCDLIGRCVFF